MAKVREFMNGLIYCITTVLSLAGLVILIIFAALHGDAFDVVSFTLFGTALFLLYLFNTLYHWLNISKRKLKFFIKFINIMNYMLIATIYTAICLGPLRGPWGWSLFGVIWGFAILGTVFSSIFEKLPKVLSIIFYTILAIVILITLYPLIQVYKNANLLYSLLWLALGVLCYIISKIVYFFKCPNKIFHQFGSNELSHLLIILGNTCQYWFIINYITLL